MALAVQQSLFEVGDDSRMVVPVRWVEVVVLSEIAVGLSVLAVAMIGALMLTGRLPLRQALRVVMGCCVLLGAHEISAAFIELREAGMPNAYLQLPGFSKLVPIRPELPPVQYNPYAQASARDDR